MVPKPSHSPRPASPQAATLSPMLSVLIRIDAAGETPLLVEDSETLCPGPGVRWRFVCQVEDREQGRAVVERLKQRPEFWNFHYPRGRASARQPVRVVLDV